jgi:MFS family permease
MLLMGGFLMGIPFGAFACLGEAFASEICPMSLRGYLTGYVNICWCIGESGHFYWSFITKPQSRRVLEPL